MVQVFLTHTPEALESYYGRRALAALEEVASVRLNPTGRVLDADALTEHAAGCEIIVSDRQTPGYREVFERSPELVAFLRCAVDIRSIDVEAASRCGILVTHATAGFADSVAELALGFMVDLARGMTDCATAYRAGRTPPVRMGRQLRGSSLGIIGFGAIGRRLSELGRALGMRVLVTDPYKRIDDPGLIQVQLRELLEQSDFVVCLAVASDETENMIDAEALSLMRPDAFFINLSRGGLVDDAALAAVLDSKRIAGAAMDVGRAPDQMPAPLLAHRPDVLATPHIAGLTPPAIEHQAFDTVEQVRAIVHGAMPAHCVNPQAGARFSKLLAGQAGERR